MFHARWATHGSENLTNVHPFHVGNDPQTVIAHNGVLNVNIPKGDDRSDTRYFAEELLPLRSAKLWDKEGKVRRMREQIMGGSKFVVFTTNPRYKHPVYIIGENLGHWDEDGTWWSNDSYMYSWRKTKRSATLGYHGLGFDADRGGTLTPVTDAAFSDEDFFCPQCQSWLTYQEFNLYRYCSCCNVCLDCNEYPGYCLCYRQDDPVSEDEDRTPMALLAKDGD